MITHIVLFRLKPNTSKEKIVGIFNELEVLKGKLFGMNRVSAGECLHGVSGEPLANFSHGFSIEFTDKKAKDNFISNPAGDKLKQIIIESTEGGIHGIMGFDINPIEK